MTTILLSFKILPRFRDTPHFKYVYIKIRSRRIAINFLHTHTHTIPYTFAIDSSHPFPIRYVQ